MTLTGRTVALTGASGGIGRATARLLAARGATVVLGARRAEPLDTLAEEIRAAGGHALVRATDVRRRENLEALVATAVERTGRLDAIVNSAGVGPISRFEALRVEDWEAMIDVNLRGTLFGIAAALPAFSRQGFGHVINVVSTAGLKVVPTMGVYAATKNAVRTATEALRQEAGPGLRVTEVSPGMTATDFAGGIADAEVRAGIEKAMDAIGLPPEAIARGILFALEQPPEVEVGSLVIRPAAQS